MSRLKQLQIETELQGVLYARMQLQVKIQERLDDVARLHEAVKIQEAKEQELKSKLSDMSDTVGE